MHIYRPPPLVSTLYEADRLYNEAAKRLGLKLNRVSILYEADRLCNS